MHGLADASRDEGQITTWATKWPNCNWAVATGPVSGVFALDVDGDAGQASLVKLEAKYGPLPLTLISISGKGRHFWFQYPSERIIRNSVGKLGPGLDIRGTGGYIVIPPSIHENGMPYQWLVTDTPVTNAPAWLLQLIAEIESATSITHSPTDGGQGEGTRIPQGRRNDTLFRKGCSRRGLGAEATQIETYLLETNEECCDPPLPATEVIKLAREICEQYPPGIIRVDANQPLTGFLRFASQKNNLEFMGRNPRAKWQSALFSFTRHVKGRAEFLGFDAPQAADRIDSEVGVDFWKQFSRIHDDPRMQFIEEWSKVRNPQGEGVLALAWAEAEQRPMIPPIAYSIKYCRCVSLFAALQRRAGEGNAFIAPQELIAKLLFVDYTTVGNYIKYLKRDGVMRLVKEPVIRQLAAEYVFDLSKLESQSQSQSQFLPETPETPETPGHTKTYQDSTDASGISDRNQNHIADPVCNGQVSKTPNAATAETSCQPLSYGEYCIACMKSSELPVPREQYEERLRAAGGRSEQA